MRSERTRAEETAEETRRALAALLHRIASPLSAICNYAHLLSASEDAEIRSGLLAAAGRGESIVRGMRRWLEGTATLRAVVPSEGADTGAVLRRACVDRPVVLELGTGALPRVGVPEPALEHIVAEIVVNAVEAAGDEPVRLVVSALSAAQVELVFSDAGRGWTEEGAAKAFDLFSIGDPESNAPGVGLAIVAALARGLGGRAWGAVPSGGGAAIHVQLPAVTQASAGGRK